MSEVYEYDWSSLPGSASAPVSTMTMEQYLALPEDVSRRIEVSSGMPIFNESPSEFHVGIQHNLTAALREATRKIGERTDDCYRVRFELDLLLAEVPTFAFRRPDVMVYRCLPSGSRGRWAKPRAADAVIVVEVVSEHSQGEDLVEKRARYAAARSLGIGSCAWSATMGRSCPSSGFDCRLTASMCQRSWTQLARATSSERPSTWTMSSQSGTAMFSGSSSSTTAAVVTLRGQPEAMSPRTSSRSMRPA